MNWFAKYSKIDATPVNGGEPTPPPSPIHPSLAPQTLPQLEPLQTVQPTTQYQHVLQPKTLKQQQIQIPSQPQPQVQHILQPKQSSPQAQHILQPYTPKQQLTPESQPQPVVLHESTHQGSSLPTQPIQPKPQHQQFQLQNLLQQQQAQQQLQQRLQQQLLQNQIQNQLQQEQAQLEQQKQNQTLPQAEEEQPEDEFELILPTKRTQANNKPQLPPRDKQQTDIFEFFLDEHTPTGTSPNTSKRITQPQLQQQPQLQPTQQQQPQPQASLLTSLLAPLASKSATNLTKQSCTTSTSAGSTPPTTHVALSTTPTNTTPIPTRARAPSTSATVPPTIPSLHPPQQNTAVHETTEEQAVSPAQIGPTESTTVRSGWLVKQGAVKKNWTKRYFVLTPSALCFYKDEAQVEEGKKVVELGSSNEMLVVDPEETEKEFCFKITHPANRTYFIHSDSRDDMIDWIIAIQHVLDKLKPVDTTPANSTQDSGGSGKSKLVKEQSVSENHEKYELVYAMLNAIRFSVGKVAPLPYLDIGMEELNAYFTFSVNRQGGSAAVPGSNFSYDFTDYAPKVFRKIRECFGFSCADYLVSLTSQYSLSELPTPGKSGSFFYFSSDRKFLLKTISSTEFDDLRKMLPNYFLHILLNPNTLLTRLYGVHKISTENVRNSFFVVMENIFMDHDMDETYDLKGSTVGRKADAGERIKKDLDLNRRILLGAEKRNALLTQLEIDCKFLEKNNIMDYSFLLGIRFISNTPEPNPRTFSSIFQKERGGYQSTTEANEFHGIIYYFGIIDIFTTYNIKKQLEHTYKSTVYETKDEISVVDAVKYADRFKKFIAKISGWKLTDISN